MVVHRVINPFSSFYPPPHFLFYSPPSYLSFLMLSTPYHVFSLSCDSVNVQRLEQAYVWAPWTFYILYIYIYLPIYSCRSYDFKMYRIPALPVLTMQNFQIIFFAYFYAETLWIIQISGNFFIISLFSIVFFCSFWLIFCPLDLDPWIRIFLRIRIQEAKILGILSTNVYNSIFPPINS